MSRRSVVVAAGLAIMIGGVWATATTSPSDSWSETWALVADEDEPAAAELPVPAGEEAKANDPGGEDAPPDSRSPTPTASADPPGDVGDVGAAPPLPPVGAEAPAGSSRLPGSSADQDDEPPTTGSAPRNGPAMALPGPAPEAPAGAPPAPPPAPEPRYATFTNVATGRCLDSDANGYSYALGCNQGDYQSWTVFGYGVVTLVDRATGRCLDSDGEGYAYTLGCNSGQYQQWTVSAGSNGAVRFINVATARCLDSNGEGYVYTLPCNGGDYQLWAQR